MDEHNYIASIESILTQHRAFGDSNYIRERMHSCYQRRLSKLIPFLPVAGILSNALLQTTDTLRYRIIGDTVLRCAINDALFQSESGTKDGLSMVECETVLKKAVLCVNIGENIGPIVSEFAHLARLGVESYHGWIWSEDNPGGSMSSSFRSVVHNKYGQLCSPSVEEIAALTTGAKLLGELLPELSRSALSHAQFIAVFPSTGWKGTVSSSHFRITGTIFLNQDMLKNPWWVAEHLLHESLHQKLYDFRHGHTLLLQDSLSESELYGEYNVSKVCSLWNVADSNRSNFWDAHRAMAAFHVYVHLAVLATVVEQRASEFEPIYGTPHLIISSRCALDRAQYLGNKIRDLCWDELGLAGRSLLEWLMSVLQVIDPSPPQVGSYTHLLLDRYKKEAKTVQRTPDLSTEILVDLIKKEVGVTRTMVLALGNQIELDRFNDALAKYTEEDFGRKFLEIRGIIGETISIFFNRYKNSPTLPGDQIYFEAITTEMIDGSSECLLEFFSG